MRTAFAREVPPRKPDSIKPIKELIIKIDGDSRVPTITLNGREVKSISKLELSFKAESAVNNVGDNQVLLSYFVNDDCPVLATIGQSIGL